MPDRKYTITYEVVDRAGPKIDALLTKIIQLDKLLNSVKANLKDLGSGNRGLANVNGKLGSMIPALKAVEAEAAKTQLSLKTLGDGVPIKVDKGTQSVSGFGRSMLALHAGMMVVHKVTEALDAMGDSAAKAREFADQGAQGGLDKRSKAREYANLLQHQRPDDEVMNRLFDVGKAGGYKFDDAVKYGEQFLGSSPAGVQAGHVTPEQLKKLEVEGARFANRIGLDAATGGDLAGVIPQYVDLTKDKNGNPLTTDQGVNKAMGQLGALQYGLNEGRGKITTLSRSEIGVASAAMAQGRITDHAEMGAFIGIASTFTKSASGSSFGFKQMDALINRSEGDEGDFLQRSGVADAKGDLAKLRKLKEHVDAQRSTSPDPANFDVGKYLTAQGFGSREEKSSTIGYLANLDVLDKRAAEARKRADNGQDVIDANRQFSTSLEGQNQLADAAAERAEYDQTSKHQRTVVARKFAVAQLRDKGELDTTDSNFKDWGEDFILNGFNTLKVHQWSGGQKAAAARIDIQVRKNMVKSARTAGVDLEKKYPGFTYGVDTDRKSIDDVMQEIGPKLEQSGVGLDGSGAPAGRKLGEAAGVPGIAGGGAGGAGGGPSQVVSAVDQVGQKIDRQTAAIVSAIRGGTGGDRAPAQPPPMPAPGNGGAGVNPGRR